MNMVGRLCTAMLLALSLALTGYGAGFARGQAPAVGEIVICRGLTTVTLPADSEGQPTSAPHLCPDGVMALFDWPGVPVVQTAALPVWTGVLLPAAGAAATGRSGVAAQARGPPSFT